MTSNVRFWSLFFLITLSITIILSWGFTAFASDIVLGEFIKVAENSTNENFKNSTLMVLPSVKTALSGGIDTMIHGSMIGMMLGIFIVSFFFKGDKHVMILIDVVIVIFMLALSVYFSWIFSLFLNQPSEVHPSFVTYFENNLSKSSNLLLNMPFYVLVVGIISILISYAFASRFSKNQFWEDDGGNGDVDGGGSIMERELAGRIENEGLGGGK